MCIHRISIIMAICGLLGLCTVAGCTQAQLDGWLGHLADPNNPGNQVAAVAESPAGEALPIPVRLLMEVLGCSAAVAWATWKQLQTRGLKGAIKPVVEAVEELSPQIQKEVKAEIEKRMLKAGGYQAKNRQVDKLKA